MWYMICHQKEMSLSLSLYRFQRQLANVRSARSAGSPMSCSFLCKMWSDIVGRYCKQRTALWYLIRFLIPSFPFIMIVIFYFPFERQWQISKAYFGEEERTLLKGLLVKWAEEWIWECRNGASIGHEFLYLVAKYDEEEFPRMQQSVDVQAHGHWDALLYK